MITITANTAIKASELDTEVKFEIALNCFAKAGLPTELSRTQYMRRYERAHFGMGNFFVGFLDESLPRDIITFDQLVEAASHIK